MPAWLFAIECVVVPASIGVAMFGLFEWWDRSRRRTRKGTGLPLIDYSI